jgi:hypothetical protein
MIDRADSNSDAQVTFDDFYNIMTKKTFAWFIRYTEIKFK